MRTAQRYIDLMKHGVTSRPSSLIDVWDVLNDAGRALYSAGNRHPYYHRWSWAVRASTTLTIPANVELVTLPDDFVREVSVRASGTGKVVVVETMDALNDFRAANRAGNTVLRICFKAGIAQDSPTKQTRPVAAIYPTQDEERSDILLTYEKDWRNLSQDRPDEIPNIPESYERLLLLMARDHLWTLQNQTPSPETAAIADELAGLVVDDSDKQDTDGRPMHSVSANANSGGFMRRRGWWGDGINTSEITRS